MIRTAIIGAGSWGTALGMQLGRNGHETWMWDRDPERAARMEIERENVRYLPGERFPDTLHVSNDVSRVLRGGGPRDRRGAELEQLIIAAMFHSFSASRELLPRDVMRVVRDTIPLAVTMDDRLKELRDWARPRARPASVDTRRVSFFEDWERE